MNDTDLEVLNWNMESIIHWSAEDFWLSQEALNMWWSWLNIDPWLLQWILVWANIFQFAAFILAAWWLYMISKKVWEKYSWLAFIPVLQIYTYIKVSQKSPFKIFVFPLIALLIGSVLAFFTAWISFILAFIYFFIMLISLYHWISQRCWRWAWSTLWLVLVPFIMFPIIGYKLEENSWSNTKKISKQKVQKNEKKDIEY